jgi:protease I
MADIANCRVAVLATDGVEQVELIEPVKALRDAGAHVTIVSLKKGSIQGMNHYERGDSIPVDAELSEVDPDQFDALLLPGGVANPDAYASRQKRLSSCADLSLRENRLPRSATVPGR